MIIEFTGTPCSGKSFIIEKLLKKIDFSVQVVKKNKYDVFFNIFLFFKYINLLNNGNGKLFLLKWVIVSKNKLFTKFRLIYNIVKKIVLYEHYNNKKGIYIFDEGISHIAFNVFINQNTDDLDLDKFSFLQRQLPLIDLIIIVKEKKNNILKRLKNRGHKRFKETPFFVEKNVEIHEALVSYHKNSKNFLKISNSQNNINLEIQKLTKLLKQRISNV